jgi:thioredoxin 1
MLSQEYSVRGIPNMQLFKDGKVVKEFVGARPMAAFRAELAAITH